jgi:ABC-type uncharacterized transport system permease subunit
LAGNTVEGKGWRFFCIFDMDRLNSVMFAVNLAIYIIDHLGYAVLLKISYFSLNLMFLRRQSLTLRSSDTMFDAVCFGRYSSAH